MLSEWNKIKVCKFVIMLLNLNIVSLINIVSLTCFCQNIVLNEGLNDNGMYDILHVFVKFLGTQHCDKNMYMHYTCFCQKFCR